MTEPVTWSRLLDRLRSREPNLFPTCVWSGELDQDINDFSVCGAAEDLDRFLLPYGLCLKAGLHVWNESLRQARAWSQDVQNETGWYWMGIICRMEGDYSEAARFFRKAGQHPALGRLAAVRPSPSQAAYADSRLPDNLRLSLKQFLLHPSWDPALFVELVQAVVTLGDPTVERILSALQKQEIVHMLEYSYGRAFGGNRP